ncbi:MAG: DUF547 domain-containing protein [Sedimentisphaerales bacterium]|nr:DUF547 domain-containing protein [Sedimentisphaerales bacterium]
MKSLWVLNLLFLTAVCSGQNWIDWAAVNTIETANSADEAEVFSDSNNSSNSGSNSSDNSSDLLNIIDVGDSNSADDYIGGDPFNLGFAQFLKEYVDERGLVNYSKMRRFRLELIQTAEKLANLKPEIYITWSRNEKIAFWINAYNICTLKGIVENYPIKPSRFMLLFYPPNSVMHLAGLRDESYFMIMGIQYTLDEIERDILLGRFEEPRACFAITYGTMGGAVLRAEPYVGKVLENQLEEQMKNYLARSDIFKIDETEKVVYLPSIFKMYSWHEEAILKRYGTNQLFRVHKPFVRAGLNFAKDYISEANAEFLKKKEYTVEYSRYNWRLNEQSTK